MKKLDFIKIALVVVLIFTGTAAAQTFTATVDKTTLGLSETFQVYFAFKGEDANQIKNFSPPSFDNFKIVSGPNESTSMQIINGKVSASLTFSYYLRPKKTGTFTIAAAGLEHKGKKFSTTPIEIVVVNTTPNTNQKLNSAQSPQDISKNLFIAATVDKRSAFVGEQVTIVYKLFTRLNISSPQISKLPNYEGFWAEDLETGKSVSFDIEMYKGERFRSAVIKKVALFPTKAGKLTVTPFELNVPVILKKKRGGDELFDNFFNDSFFGRTETQDYIVKSNPVSLDVNPLPGGAPESFNGAVGNFDLEASLNKTEVEQNESVSLSIKISGSGNIKLLEVPEIELPSGFEKYDPKTSEKISKSNLVSGVKSIEYLLVPRIAGKKSIPPIAFTYFNPKSKKYITENSNEFTLNVLEGEGMIAGNTEGFSKEDVKLLSEDIRYIKTSSFDLKEKGEFNKIRTWFWFAAIFPVLILAGLVLVRKRKDRLNGNQSALRFQKAEKAAKQRLKTAKKFLEEKKLTKFYTEISIALSGYLEDKLNIQKSEFTLEKALAKLKKKNIPDELIIKLKMIMEDSEYARFAPDGEQQAKAGSLYQYSVDVIISLEKYLRGKIK